MKNRFNFKVKSLISSMVLCSSLTAFAQTGANFNNDQQITIPNPITAANSIVRVTVHFIDHIPGSIAAGGGLVDNGIALSTASCTQWSEYSTYVRFGNTGTLTGVIDARNGAAIGKPANDIKFDYTKSYYIWFTINPITSKYSVSAQDASGTTVVVIAADFGFRAPSTSLGVVQILHNGQTADGIILNIDEVTYPTSIVAGPVIITPVTGIKSLSNANKFKTIINGNEVRFNQMVKSAELIDVTGKTISKSSNVSSLNIGKANTGICIIKTDKGIVKVLK